MKFARLGFIALYPVLNRGFLLAKQSMTVGLTRNFDCFVLQSK